MWMFIWGIQRRSVDNMLVCNIVFQGMPLKYLLVEGMDYSLMIYFMNKGVWSHLMIGEHKTKGVKVDSRTQVQIGEIKFNFLLPHQGALPQDPLPGEEKESSEELTTPSITSPTPPPETEKTLLKPDI